MNLYMQIARARLIYTGRYAGFWHPEHLLCIHQSTDLLRFSLLVRDLRSKHADVRYCDRYLQSGNFMQRCAHCNTSVPSL